MSKKVLYLHIGWSKTGTSAVQYQLDKQFEELKARGILYSKSMQMNDNAHHHFALAFKPIHGYSSKYDVDGILRMLNGELDEHGCDSLIISSELSSEYYRNQKFMNWVGQFEKVIIIATLRQQSDLLLSLFNQLVKDPQVRYKGTFFQLAISNFSRLNYFQNLQGWDSHFGKDNVLVFPYGNDIVERMLGYFNLSVVEEEGRKVVNPSLPNSLLSLLQNKTKTIDNPNEYRKIRDQLLIDFEQFKKEPNRVLVTKGELATIDQYFDFPNSMTSKRYLSQDRMFTQKNYNDICVYE